MIKLEKIDALFELADFLSHQYDYGEIVRLITQKALSLFDAASASIVLVNPNTQNTVKTILRDGGINEQLHQLVQANIVGWVSKNKETFLSGDIQTDERFMKGLFSDSSVRSAVCAPLVYQNRVIGFTVLLDNHAQKFDAESLALFEKYALICAPVLANTPRIEDYFERIMPETALVQKYKACGLLGQSTAFIDLLKAVEAAAHCDVRVLLEGRSGTGKELIARAIHQNSSRFNFPFVAVDCGAIPENLVESELFGHTRGSFTGATQDRKGLFEEAHQGTFFIDEIENLPMNMQSKLLRVVQEGEVRIVGSNRVRKVNVRIIAASSNSLQKMVENGAFREDLYYRLYVYPISIPTLTERKEDILLLAEFFLKKYAGQQGKNVSAFDQSISKFMKTKTWRGNVRELENFVERLVALMPTEKKIVTRAILPSKLKQEINELQMAEPIFNGSVKQAVCEYERQLYIAALQDHRWNQSHTARYLKISERMLRYNMQRLGIQKPTDS